MKNYLRLICVFLVLFILTLHDIFGQPPSPPEVTYLNTFGREDGKILYFPYVNQYLYYRDETKLKELDKLAEKGDYEAVYTAMYEYVMRFGSQNFYKDNYMIWRLGKLAEELKYLNKARMLYQLVLKHHRYGDDKNYRLYYDSLTRNDKDYYLPVKYYYTMSNAGFNIDTLQIPESVYTALGDSVNSRNYNDYGPSLSGNDLILLFTSQRKQRLSGMKYVSDEGLYYARKADSTFIRQTNEGSIVDTLPWTQAKPFVGLNTDSYNEGSATISRDGKTIFFARCDSPDGLGNCDLYVSRRKTDGTWTKGTNLGINVNTIAWDSQPALSHTEDTLFFASDRMGGFGGSDLYFTYKYKDRNGFDYKIIEYENNYVDTLWNWAPAQNIGPIINTRRNEVSPFYHPIFNVLYFSSDGQLINFGGFDIYKSYREGLTWKEPKNTGPLINYRTDEYYFTIDSKAQNLYYAKAIPTKVFDMQKRDSVMVDVLNLHTAALPMEAQPLAVDRLEVAITDSITGEPSKGFIAIIDLDEGVEVAPRYIRDNGTARFDLIRNRNYLIIITGDDFLRIEEEFLFKGDTTIQVYPIKFDKWVFDALEFDEASSKITDKMKPDLDKLVDYFLADHPNLGIKISGHTDNQGTDASNLQLSQERADAIKQYILDRGRFKPNRVNSIGHGSRMPIILNATTEEERRKNRRVEFEIFKIY
jgi:hypothetical protein